MRRTTRNSLLLALLAATFLALPAAAHAGCGGVQYLPAKKKPKTGRPPLAIGDSTMLLAMPALSRAGYNVDAHGCRGMEEGLAILRRRRAAKRLPHLSVIALGTDFTISRRQIKRALHYLGPDRVLGLVTPWELGGYAGNDARVMRAAAQDYKKRIVLLDWVKFSRGHGGWFQPDGCHLTFAGARAFARLFKRALPYSQPPAPPAES
ncbi:MAG: hypothetical protein QOJ57_2905 [Thermoleophilaceae bacterium]|nr:hypothetical protein [Thermoleophilaceae bacterium]